MKSGVSSSAASSFPQPRHFNEVWSHEEFAGVAISRSYTHFAQCRLCTASESVGELRLCPLSRIRSPRTTTAPTGTSPPFAASLA